MDREKLNEILNRLTPLKLEAENAQADMSAFKKKLDTAVADFAFLHFRELKDMDADDIRKFGSIISEYSRSLAEDLNKLNYKVKNK